MNLKQRVKNIRKNHSLDKVSFDFGNRVICIAREYDSVTLEEIYFHRQSYEKFLEREDVSDPCRAIVQRMLNEISLTEDEYGYILYISGNNDWPIRRDGNLPLSIYR